MEDQIQNPESVLPKVPEKKQPDLEGVLSEAKKTANSAIISIDKDLTTAINLGERAGEDAGPVIEQINALKDEVSEREAAFEARVERLNSPYVLSPEMAKVLKVSRVLEKPLLLEGEPGTGKTSLAYALAGNEDLPIIHAQCKSTTTAKDLLYTFDVVKRLQDAQLGKDVLDLSQYVRLGPLGKAFAGQEQVILLIDEVDKAKRDFSNDLLHELDQMSFFVEETGEEISARHRPVVIITSNHERDLPEPLLRRVVYHYIDFPPPEQMTEIVKAHIPDVGERLLESAIQRFYAIRNVDNLEKKPSTSEMLDWIRVLKRFGVEKVDRDIPYPGVLLKHKKDYERTVVVGQKEEEKHPETVIVKEVIKGNKVVRLSAAQSGYNRHETYKVLANAGYIFTTDDYEQGRDFDIDAEGVIRIGREYIFSINMNLESAKELYELLNQNHLLEKEYEITKKPCEFITVDESNEFFIKGRDSNGDVILKLANGKFIQERKIYGNWTEKEAEEYAKELDEMD